MLTVVEPLYEHLPRRIKKDKKQVIFNRASQSLSIGTSKS
jgi:hypothetical protein